MQFETNLLDWLEQAYKIVVTSADKSTLSYQYECRKCALEGFMFFVNNQLNLKQFGTIEKIEFFEVSKEVETLLLTKTLEKAVCSEVLHN